MRQLIINADDFGLHSTINQAIVEGVEAGVINSTSVSMPGSDIDAKLLQQLHEKGVFIGLHLTWVGEKWLSSDIHIEGWRDFILQYTLKRKSLLKAMHIEAEAQLAAFKKLSIPLSHIDGHQHLHVFPGVSEFVFEMAEHNGNCRVRIPAAPTNKLRRQGLGGLALQQISQKLLSKHKDSFQCIGIKNSGHYTPALLIEELKETAANRIEIVAHPGASNSQLAAKYPTWGFNWEKEHAALLSPDFKAAIEDSFTLLKR